MQFNSETPRRDITIQGKTFSCPEIFKEGHVCTAAEAGALNQLLVENTRNNFATRLKDFAEGKEGVTEPTQADFDEYVSEYEFGARRTSSGVRTPVDPVEKEAFDLAVAAVKAQLAKKNLTIKQAGGTEKLKEYASQVLAANRDKLIAQATEIVKARNETAVEELDISDFGATETEQAA